MTEICNKNENELIDFMFCVYVDCFTRDENMSITLSTYHDDLQFGTGI